MKSGYLEVSFDVLQSLRSSERGLKSISPAMSDNLPLVAPFVGAWIEINLSDTNFGQLKVAPFVGAWIEMLLEEHKEYIYKVAPFVGAWIEIHMIWI